MRERLCAQTNLSWIDCSLFKKDAGIFIGRVLKRYSILGSTDILQIAVLPNHEKFFGCQLARSASIALRSGGKLLSNIWESLRVSQIPKYLSAFFSHLKGQIVPNLGSDLVCLYSLLQT